MEITSAEFSELTINQVSDLLLEVMNESGEACSKALLKGKDQDGNMYNLIVFLEPTRE